MAQNHFCDPVLNSRFRSGPCETCADHGFKPDRPALLYLVIKSTLAAAKVGIRENSPRNARLAEHRRNGWTLLHELAFPQGTGARAREKATVESWRARGWTPVLDGKLAYDGYMETVSLRSISAEGIWAEIVSAEAAEIGRRL
ncbi:hypothetical protein [Streptomyces sp. NPDC091027]|uniref:hypothetical protein n=1 Tax=Streptomyces sp. NPDC091027 TaxID=3365971 RepID=UPI00382EA7EB